MSRSTQLRRQEIQNLIIKNGEMSIEQLSKHFNVSLVTIRKDAQILEQEGKAIRGYSKLKSMIQVANSSDVVHSLMKHNFSAKERIVERAAEMVNDWDVVLLAPGSTCCMLAKILSKRSNVILVTNAVSFASELVNCNARLVYLGGEYNSRTGSTTGSFMLDTLSSINIDKFFMGANGVLADVGITSFDFSDSFIVRRMIERSKEVILVADHTKFGKANALTVIGINDIDTVITNKEISEEVKATFNKQGQNLILV